jgi:NAD(P) transhydrogenase
MYGVAVELEPTATLPRLMSRKSAIIGSESKRIRDNLDRHGVTLMHGHARFVDAHTVEVTGDVGTRRVTGEAILVATGSRPARPRASTSTTRASTTATRSSTSSASRPPWRSWAPA